MRPRDVRPISVLHAADGYSEMVRAKAATGALSPGTAEVYCRDVGTFAALADGQRILDDLEGPDVDAVLLAFARKPDGRSPAASPTRGRPSQSASSQARFRRSVSAFFQYAVLTGWVTLNPMGTATVVSRRRGGLASHRRALTTEQAAGLLAAARELGGGAPAGPPRRADQRTELRDALIVVLLAATGPRVSELTRSDLEDFFPDGGVRYWRIRGKGGRTRDVPLPGEVARLLDAYLVGGRPALVRASTPGDALLLSWRGRRLARGDVQGVIDRVLARVPADRRRSVTPHGLRHTTATHLLAAAVDMDAVRRVLGHSDLSTLGRYRDDLPGELEVAMRTHPLLTGAGPGAAGSQG